MFYLLPYSFSNALYHYAIYIKIASWWQRTPVNIVILHYTAHTIDARWLIVFDVW